MKIIVKDYEMTHEEMISEIVQLRSEKTLEQIKVDSLVTLLIEKGIITNEEVKLSLKNYFSNGLEVAKENGIESEHFNKFANDYLFGE